MTVVLGRLESLRLVRILRTQLRSGDGHVHDGTGMKWSKCSVARAKVQQFAHTVSMKLGIQLSNIKVAIQNSLNFVIFGMCK